MPSYDTNRNQVRIGSHGSQVPSHLRKTSDHLWHNLSKGAHETTQTRYVKVQDLITSVPGKEGLTVDSGGTLLKNNWKSPPPAIA